LIELKQCSGEQRAFAISESRAKQDIHGVAVLPFLASSTSPDAEYLADGITESLINNLAQLTRLRVVARSAVYRRRGKDVDPICAGHELSVEAVLTGKVFQRGELLVIGAELADFRDGSQIWGQQYKRQLTDIFAIEEELSREIVERLRTKLTIRHEGQLQRRYTENPEAYQFYLRGRHAWNKRTLDGMRQAVTFFHQAIELDPTYARAFTGLADAIQMLSIYGDMESRQARIKARAAQDRALEIDESLAEAVASAGFRTTFFDWNFEQAEQALRRAIKLNSTYAPAHQWLGFVLGITGRTEEALRSLTVAQELDPFSASISTTAAWPLLWARRGKQAVAAFRAAVEAHPGLLGCAPVSRDGVPDGRRRKKRSVVRPTGCRTG
jgi:TolB-like protein